MNLLLFKVSSSLSILYWELMIKKISQSQTQFWSLSWVCHLTYLTSDCFIWWHINATFTISWPKYKIHELGNTSILENFINITFQYLCYRCTDHKEIKTLKKIMRINIPWPQLRTTGRNKSSLHKVHNTSRSEICWWFPPMIPCWNFHSSSTEGAADSIFSLAISELGWVSSLTTDPHFDFDRWGRNLSFVLELERDDKPHSETVDSWELPMWHNTFSDMSSGSSNCGEKQPFPFSYSRMHKIKDLLNHIYHCH